MQNLTLISGDSSRGWDGSRLGAVTAELPGELDPTPPGGNAASDGKGAQTLFCRPHLGELPYPTPQNTQQVAPAGSAFLLSFSAPLETPFSP